MTEGLITKALSGYYYVMPDDDHTTLVQCRGRGILKLKGDTPLVGDRVRYELTSHGEGVINELLPRRSQLVRPPVANVDLAIIVFSLVEPELNVALLDKFLAHIEAAQLEAVICLTKHDLLTANEEHNRLAEICELYGQIGYDVIMTSTKTGEGIETLKERLKGRVAVLCGQSGVGKSSLLNALVPSLQLETAAVSSKLGRGRHTTRHVALISLSGDGVVADTPGFSQLDFIQMEAPDLTYAFKEFPPFAAQCKFRGCLHLQEPECGVLSALEAGDIASSRYEHYQLFVDEIRNQERRY